MLEGALLMFELTEICGTEGTRRVGFNRLFHSAAAAVMVLGRSWIGVNRQTQTSRLGKSGEN
jgi:hypothetical protein